MPTFTQIKEIRPLIDAILRRGAASKVHFAKEAGFAATDSPSDAAHRFSICLSEKARYVIMQGGKYTTIEIKRGEAIYALPHCHMQSHPQARYLSFGLVFQTGLTRYLFAKKVPQKAQELSHRFLLTHHSQTGMDEDGRAFLNAISHCANTPTDIRYLQTLITLLLLKSQALLDARPHNPKSKAMFTWQAARNFIDEHIHEPICRQDVASFLRIHPNHISRLFSQFDGKKFQQYLHQTRMERARLLMENSSLNISEIANACGFTDANYFSRCYRKYKGD